MGQETQDDGASPSELVMEASRRNNADLLADVLKSVGSPAAVAEILNTSVDGVGNHCLHVAAAYGSYETLDVLLDQEGVEVDPRDRLDRETPLHKAVKWVNEQERAEWAGVVGVVELLIDAGADPRIRNREKLTPLQLVHGANTELQKTLRLAALEYTAGDDVVREEEGGEGSASDSD